MMVEGGGASFLASERPFWDYFKRLKSIGFSTSDIYDKLPSMEKYYKEMVVDGLGVDYFHRWEIPRLVRLWDKWVDYER